MTVVYSPSAIHSFIHASKRQAGKRLVARLEPPPINFVAEQFDFSSPPLSSTFAAAAAPLGLSLSLWAKSPDAE